VRRVDKTLAAVIAAALGGTLGISADARAWEFRDFVSPLGDKGTGISQPDADGVGATFVFACDGDRWRIAALMPTREKPLRFASAGKVRFSFDKGLGPAGVWKSSELEGGMRAYEIPQPSTFVAKMVAEEQRSADTVLRIELLDSKKKRHTLHFPLRGLRESIRKNLWEPCKLENYLGSQANRPLT
jgi:hypothetical protein